MQESGPDAFEDPNRLAPALCGERVIEHLEFSLTHIETGEKFKMRFSLVPNLDGKALGGATVSTGDEILGSDHQTSRLGHWFFGSKGFHGSGH